ncbi:hypothetical protein P7K49_021316 [Saguinus oedipus]|uniref:Uncharacterized protein n=1 Tax=Saguinus oedipus TaxID=9490 RepID=A0ABQ9UU19_SAGOE|nr:hypothetical protein P7K49_021316 [Saguinus oedipus]
MHYGWGDPIRLRHLYTSGPHGLSSCFLRIRTDGVVDCARGQSAHTRDTGERHKRVDRPHPLGAGPTGPGCSFSLSLRPGLLEIKAVALRTVAIKGVHSVRYLCMGADGRLQGLDAPGQGTDHFTFHPRTAFPPPGLTCPVNAFWWGAGWGLAGKAQCVSAGALMAGNKGWEFKGTNRRPSRGPARRGGCASHAALGSLVEQGPGRAWLPLPGPPTPERIQRRGRLRPNQLLCEPWDKAF